MPQKKEKELEIGILYAEFKNPDGSIDRVEEKIKIPRSLGSKKYG